MNLSLVRWVDFWVGVSVCFLLSLFKGIVQLFFKPKTSPGPVKKILFIKLSELGAILLAYPLMRRIKNQFPDAQIYFLTFSKGKGVFKLLGGLCPDEHILTIRENAFFFIPDLIQVLIRLCREKVDISIDLEFFARVSAILSFFSKAPKRVGFHRYDLEGLYRGNLLTHKVFYNPLQHVTRNYLAMAQNLELEEKLSPEVCEGITPEDLVFPAYESKPDIHGQIRTKLKKCGLESGQRQIFLMNPGEGMLPLREWPLENFIEVARKILEQEHNDVVLIGTEGAEEKTAMMQRALQHPHVISLVGKTNLEELMELFLISKALISNDCGLVHLAMLTPLQKYVFFGPESPAIFGPLDSRSHIFYSNWPCSPCLSALNHRQSACRINECLKKISVDEVQKVLRAS